MYTWAGILYSIRRVYSFIIEFQKTLVTESTVSDIIMLSEYIFVFFFNLRKQLQRSLE